MASIERKLITSKEVQERCSDWVESQKELLYSEDNVLKRKRENEHDEYFDTDSEFDSVSECGTKRRRLAKQMKDEVLNLLCEWKDCLFDSTSMEVFTKHVANHIPQLEIKTTEEDKEVYVCQWKGCSGETAIPQEISRHVNYHAFHAKLKCIGSNIRGRIKLSKCYRDAAWKNVIDTPSAHICEWENCLKTYNNYQIFLYHVTAHIEANPRGNKVEGGVKCKWLGCQKSYPNLYKLRNHMRSHTKEKLVACPDCGATFASNSKFHDHCRRQIPIEVQGFQCSHCNKFYPTEGILRNHMRLHVFNYKCTMCDMSCESPASLAKHIRYRHVSTRSFPCQLCSHAAKSQQDLDSHMTVHTNGPLFACTVEGCLYTCKGAYILDRHMQRVHDQEIRWYCCHECPIKYRKSYRLTKHLIEAHHLQWPNGHKRFQYTQDEDGCYRLQMVRYESIDEENISPTQELALPEKKYDIRLDDTTPYMKLEITERDDGTSSSGNGTLQFQSQDNIGKSMPIISNILISIDEVDAEGNIIKSKVVETQETKELPPSEEPPIILT
ncbi:histone H4 transcription factor [Cephus cinctus]|uniref:Histone H4 transcription factor n=1 Tax=Cephus cinctus TaxID=211228 RepID=A0AAJ7FTL4_CEPCN|nr:histone H4 transcription factor [Cephus cinctus]XP_015607649.1 histone H4 transcription factor [Cephus cinctus]XP_024946816.1 histone H4 transcription factor [Cephus cinctus]